MQPEAASALPVRHLGVDDWAWRKGQDYGTILVNLDAHRVIDLLPDRSAESFSGWLQQHPEIESIARDRCGLYAEGAALGAAQAQQIADPFHLMLNLSAMLERVFEERSRQLILPPEESAVEAQSENCNDLGAGDPATVRPSASELRRQRRLERYRQGVALFQAVRSQRDIGRELDMNRKTVRRWLRRGEFPERKARSCRSGPKKNPPSGFPITGFRLVNSAN